MRHKLGKLSSKYNKMNKMLLINKFNFTTINNNDYHISQTNSFNEELLLVDENDRKVGSITKLDGKLEFQI